MSVESNETKAQYSRIFLFVAGMGVGGLIAALLFVAAVGGGLVQLT